MRYQTLITAAFVMVVGCSEEDDSTLGPTTNGSGAGTTSSQTGGGGATSAGGMGGNGVGGSGAAGASGGAGGSTQGCGDSSPPTGAMTGNIQVANDTRTYVLSVPGSYDPNTALPLVFAWHGGGGNGTLARQYFGVEQQSNGQAIFVYPDGLIVMGNTGWDLSTTGNDVALFDALLADISQHYCVDTNRIFSTGHSFGGYFSNSLGCARANVLRAIAPVAGGGPFGGNCSGPLAAWITHGSNDTTVALAQGQGSRDHWLGANGCGNSTSPVNPTPCEAYQGCQAGADLHWCQHTGGHGWPNFAAAAIWDFFAAMP